MKMPPAAIVQLPWFNMDRVASWLVRVYGALVAADLVMALAFEQSMQMVIDGRSVIPLPNGLVAMLNYDNSLPHLKQWQIITIGGFSAYQFITRNDELLMGWRMLSWLPGYYSIGQLTLILAAIQRLRKRFDRPDSPTDAGTR